MEEKPCILDKEAAHSAARRVVFEVPLSKWGLLTEYVVVLAPEEDLPPITLSNSSGEDHIVKEEKPTSERILHL